MRGLVRAGRTRLRTVWGKCFSAFRKVSQFGQDKFTTHGLILAGRLYGGRWCAEKYVISTLGAGCRPPVTPLSVQSKPIHMPAVQQGKWDLPSVLLSFLPFRIFPSSDPTVGMRLRISAILTVASAAIAVASPTWQALQGWEKGPNGRKAPQHTSSRPDVSCHPKSPHHPPPPPLPRHKVCYVESHNDGTDDSPYIVAAIDACNNGGHVVFMEGVEYIIGTALNLTYLNSIDIGTFGDMLFSLHTI